MSVVIFVLSAPVTSTGHADEAEPADGDLADIVLTHELRTAFYERASWKLSAAMTRAARAWCSSADRERIASSGDANAETVGWLCSNRKLRYFRSVYINGDRGPHGLVCVDDGTSGFKYVGMDVIGSFVETGACVPAEFDGTAYELQFESVNVARGEGAE